MKLTERERIEILMMIGYGDRTRTQEEVCRLFNEAHPDRLPVVSNRCHGMAPAITVSQAARVFYGVTYLKSKVYENRPLNVKQLKGQIREEMRRIYSFQMQKQDLTNQNVTVFSFITIYYLSC